MFTGYIYIIFSEQHNNIYIGSTKLELADRLQQHELNLRKYNRGKYNYVSSFDVLNLGNYTIQYIHKGEYKTRKALRQQEGRTLKKFMKMKKFNVVNDKMEGE